MFDEKICEIGQLKIPFLISIEINGLIIFLTYLFLKDKKGIDSVKKMLKEKKRKIKKNLSLDKKEK